MRTLSKKPFACLHVHCPAEKCKRYQERRIEPFNKPEPEDVFEHIQWLDKRRNHTMKRALLIGTINLMFLSTTHAACQKGYVPSDTPGVCVESVGVETNPVWIIDEKPPKDKMPSWQREGIKVVEEKNLAFEDAKADREKAEADRSGKKAAGIKAHEFYQ